jgi:hypothetical protein
MPIETKAWAGSFGIGVGLAGLKMGDPEMLVDADHAKSARVLNRDLDRADHCIRALSDEPVIHLDVVHLVDVIACKNEQELGMLAVDQKHVLVDGVGRATIPIFADSLLRRDGGDVLAQLGVENVPADANVPVERMGFVLDQYRDFAQPRVEAIAQREVDDPVFSAERDRRLRTMRRQRKQPFTLAASQDHREHVLHGRKF